MKARITYLIVFTAVVGILFFFILNSLENYVFTVNKATVSIEITAEKYDTLEVFYDKGSGWQKEHKVIQSMPKNSKNTLIVFPKLNMKDIRKIRLDLGWINKDLQIKNAFIFSAHDTIEILKKRNLLTFNCLKYFPNESGKVEVDPSCEDPHLIYNGDLSELKVGKYSSSDRVKFFVFLIVYCLIALFVWLKKPYFEKIGKIKPQFILFITVFILFISMHWLSIFAGFDSVDFNLERRAETPFPEFKQEDFAIKTQEWCEDHLAIRQELTFYKSFIDYSFFDKSTLPKKVLIGKDKELFTTAEYILDDFQGKMELSLPQLLFMRKVILERIAYMKSRGKHYYLFMPPSKQTVYPDYLPSRYSKNYKKEKTMMSQLMTFLANDSVMKHHVCDPTDVLIQELKKGKYPIYCKNDVHWNGYGAFYGYNYLFKQIEKDHPEMKPYEFDDFSIAMKEDNQGDLATQLLLHNIQKRKVYDFKLKNGVSYDLEIIHGKYVYPLYHTTKKNKKLPKALIFRDSFAQDLIPFFSLHFSDALYVWDLEFDVDLIEEKNPDYVIHEVTELFIYHLLQFNDTRIQIEN